MLFLLLERNLLTEIAELPVDAHAHITVAANLIDDLAVLALLPAHKLRHDEQLRPLGQCHDLIDHLVDTLLCDRLAAAGAVRTPCTRIEQTQVIVNLRHGSDRRTRVVAGRFLIN